MPRNFFNSNNIRQRTSRGQTNSSSNNKTNSAIIEDDVANGNSPHQRSFYLFSKDGQSLKRTLLETKKQPALAKSRVCVVSIICKDKLNGTIREELVQSLLGSKYELKTPDTGRKDYQEKKNPDDDFLSSHEYLDSDNLDVSIFETQVTGDVNCDSDIVVLSLTSILEADMLHRTIKPPGTTNNCLHPTDWPLRNQNLIKTMLIMFSLSHIVIFYNPDLSLDHNLIQTLNILNVLRLKSLTRITDLLAVIDQKRYLPEKWVRQARLCIPRAIFVCGVNNCDFNPNQKDMSDAKRNLEDQIYMILKKCDVISPNSSKSTSISLPESEEFVFIFNQQTQSLLKKNKQEFLHDGSKNTIKSFYSNLLNSYNNNPTDDEVYDPQSIEESSVKASGSRALNQNRDEIDPAGSLKCFQQKRFRKFVQKHVSDIRSLAEHHDKKSSIVIPNYENLITVLASLSDLFFPVMNDNLGLSSPFWCWKNPDERRYVDVYGLLNHEADFSKKFCSQIRDMAFAIFLDKISGSSRKLHDFNMLLQTVMQFYMANSRGPAYLTYKDLLIEDCKNHWHETRDDTRTTKSKRNNKISRTKSHDPASSKLNRYSDCSLLPNDKKDRSQFSVTRHKDAINLSNSCECGHTSNFIITSRNSKISLDHVYIKKTF